MVCFFIFMRLIHISLDLHQSVEIDGFFREYFANFACCEKQNKAAANPSAGFIALNKNIFDE